MLQVTNLPSNYLVFRKVHKALLIEKPSSATLYTDGDKDGYSVELWSIWKDAPFNNGALSILDNRITITFCEIDDYNRLTMVIYYLTMKEVIDFYNEGIIVEVEYNEEKLREIQELAEEKAK